MNQEKIMQKLVDAGMVNEVVSAETMMEQLIKEKSKIMHVGKSFVIKYTGENPVACLWDEAKIKK